MRSIIAFALAVSMLPLTANAALQKDDASYLKSAMQTQLGRYALASLAQKNASNPQVKHLAATIASQASAQLRTLESVAKTNGVPPAKSPSVRDSYHYSQLSGLHGKDFDTQFVQELKVDDQIVSSNDQTESSHGSDPKLRSFAKDRLSALQHELKVLDKLPS